MPWPSAQLHPSTIADDGNQPRRHLCLPSELIQVFVSGEERILNRILCVGRIAQVSIRCSTEQRQTTRERLLNYRTLSRVVCRCSALPRYRYAVLRSNGRQREKASCSSGVLFSGAGTSRCCSFPMYAAVACILSLPPGRDIKMHAYVQSTEKVFSRAFSAT